jgi:rare lipoprotein A (peptidoglycan hydrolase)
MDKGRLACAAAFLAVGSLLGSTSAASAGGGGTTVGDGETATADSSYQKLPFGARNLRRGNRGDDVKTLHWLLRSEAMSVPFDSDFDKTTESAVKDFQSDANINRTGVVKKSTRKAIAKRMDVNNATWYGPGFWGNQTACGKTLKKTTVGVAHKTLPCGTRVTFAYNGHWVRAKVIDRGPYNKGYQWDLSRMLAKRLGFINSGAGKLKVAVAGR